MMRASEYYRGILSRLRKDSQVMEKISNAVLERQLKTIQELEMALKQAKNGRK